MAAFPPADALREALDRSAALDTLRFLTCGHVDDGKSTLIGRLLFDAGRLFDDQLAALVSDSRRHGTQGDRPDFALLVDGLLAEREQAITIDVAYRYFATPRRRFLVADCPGHERYTRNMATGASTCDLAVLLVDVRSGLRTQTCRHARIAAMMGVRHVVLAVNKLDLVGFDGAAFMAVETAFRSFAADLGFSSIAAVPLVALDGDNVAAPSGRMPWYQGPPLLALLEAAEGAPPSPAHPFRLPVQHVCRPDPGFRGYAGRIAAGRVRPGDAVRVWPSGERATIARIVALGGDRPEASCGEAVMLTLEEDRDVARGDVLAAADDAGEPADQFEAHVLWLHEAPLMPGRPYQAQIHALGAGVTVTQLRWRVDPDTGARLAVRSLGMNEIAVANVAFDRPIPFAPYAACRPLGAFLIIDRQTNETVGAGMIAHALRRSANLTWQPLQVDRAARAALKRQRPRCIWLTGLPAAGKSTLASLLEQRLHAEGRHTYVLDGDNVRHGLNRDLGFTAADRVENVRRVAEVARLMVDAGLVVIVSMISPFRAERDLARGLFDEGEFVEVFVDAPPSTCEARDPKGLWAKARRGELQNFTGVDSPYEAPVAAEVVVGDGPPEAGVDRLIAHLRAAEEAEERGGA